MNQDNESRQWIKAMNQGNFTIQNQSDWERKLSYGSNTMRDNINTFESTKSTSSSLLCTKKDNTSLKRNMPEIGIKFLTMQIMQFFIH